MGWPIVIVTTGGIPVTEATNKLGTPVEVAANGRGTPVTIVANGGLPVVGSGGGAPVLLTAPAGLGWSPSANFYRSPGGVYTTDFTVASKVPVWDTILYIDPQNTSGTASDSANGTSRTTAKRNLGTLLTAINAGTVAAAGTNIFIIVIGLTADFVAKTSAGPNGVVPTKTIGYFNESPTYRFICPKVASATGPTWSASTGYTGAGVYQTTIAAASCYATVDFAMRTTPVSATGLTLSFSAPMYNRLVKRASVQAVADNAGSWYHDGTNLFVKTLDGRAPDANVLPLAAGDLFRTNAGGTGQTLYIGGKIDAVGGSAGRFIATADTNTGTIVLDEGCSFQAGCNSVQSGITVAVQGPYEVYAYRAAAFTGDTDNWNFHNRLSDGAATFSPRALLNETVAWRGGVFGSTDVSSNDDTAHDGSIVVGLNTYDLGSDDRTWAYIQNSKAWFMGGEIGPTVQGSLGVAGKESIALLGSGGDARLWMDGVRIAPNPVGQIVVSNGALSAAAYTRNMTVPTRSGTAEDTGTLQTY